MAEPTTDDKIQQLVKAVLEAVDTRLDDLRAELNQASAEATQRHLDAMAAVATLERRVVELAARPEPTPTTVDHDDLNARLAAATRVLAERMESAQHAALVATEQALAALRADVEALRRRSLSLDTSQVRQMTSLPIPPMSAPTFDASTFDASTTGPVHEDIDIDRLTSLINARLEHLTLPQAE